MLSSSIEASPCLLVLLRAKCMWKGVMSLLSVCVHPSLSCAGPRFASWVTWRLIHALEVKFSMSLRGDWHCFSYSLLIWKLDRSIPFVLVLAKRNGVDWLC